MVPGLDGKVRISRDGSRAEGFVTAPWSSEYLPFSSSSSSGEAIESAARAALARHERKQGSSTARERSWDEDECEDAAKLDYERGDCAILALRLAELTGLPLVGMFEGKDLHHVAVEVDREHVLDVRGVSTKRKRAMDAGRPEARWRRVDLRTIRAHGLPGWDGYGADELDAVDSAADDALAQM
jgi:hypothetical protein